MVVIGGLSLVILAGCQALLAEPIPDDIDMVEVIESTPDSVAESSTPVHPTPVPSSLHLLAMGLLLVPAAHKLRWIPR